MESPISNAIKIAESRITEIFTVQEWSEQMGFNSYDYFSHVFRNHFGIRPKAKLNQIRLDLFFKLIKEDPQQSHYELALSLGLRDEKALNKYIKRHTGKAPSGWKKESKKG